MCSECLSSKNYFWTQEGGTQNVFATQANSYLTSLIKMNGIALAIARTLSHPGVDIWRFTLWPQWFVNIRSSTRFSDHLQIKALDERQGLLIGICYASVAVDHRKSIGNCA